MHAAPFCGYSWTNRRSDRAFTLPSYREKVCPVASSRSLWVPYLRGRDRAVEGDPNVWFAIPTVWFGPSGKKRQRQGEIPVKISLMPVIPFPQKNQTRLECLPGNFQLCLLKQRLTPANFGPSQGLLKRSAVCVHVRRMIKSQPEGSAGMCLPLACGYFPACV